MVNSPERLLSLIVDAVVHRDSDSFTNLCETHNKLILQYFHVWSSRPPEQYTQSSESMSSYGYALYCVADLFARNGNPELLSVFQPADDLMRPLQQRLDLAKSKQASGRLSEALEEVSRLLGELTQVGGRAALDLRAKGYGLAGSLLFVLGRKSEARAATELALADCEAGGDEEGVRVYNENLALMEAYTLTPEDELDHELLVLRMVARAQRLTDFRRYEASNLLLSELVEREVGKDRAVDSWRANILGRLGFNYYKLGDSSRSAHFLEAARQFCLDAHDFEGAQIYAENLAEIPRDRS